MGEPGIPKSGFCSCQRIAGVDVPILVHPNLGADPLPVGVEISPVIFPPRRLVLNFGVQAVDVCLALSGATLESRQISLPDTRHIIGGEIVAVLFGDQQANDQIADIIISLHEGDLFLLAVGADDRQPICGCPGNSRCISVQGIGIRTLKPAFDMDKSSALIVAIYIRSRFKGLAHGTADAAAQPSSLHAVRQNGLIHGKYLLTMPGRGQRQNGI